MPGKPQTCSENAKKARWRLSENRSARNLEAAAEKASAANPKKKDRKKDRLEDNC